MTKIPVHPLLQKLTNNLGTEWCVVLSGYVSPSNEENVIRLCSNLEMSHYIDISSDDVLDISSKDPTERVKLFIRGSASIKLTKTLPAKAYELGNGEGGGSEGGGGDGGGGEGGSDGDGDVDPPQQTGGGNYTLNDRLRMIMYYKKLFKRYS